MSDPSDPLRHADEVAAPTGRQEVTVSLSPAALADCASGRELATAGFAADVAVAADLDVSRVVPALTGDAFVPAT